MNKFNLKYYCPSFAWAIFILIICLIPGNKLPEAPFEKIDLVIHLGSYAFLSYTILYAWIKTNFPVLFKTLVTTWALISLYGLLIEVLQAVLPIHRSFSLMDYLANSCGALFIFAYYKLKSKI